LKILTATLTLTLIVIFDNLTKFQVVIRVSGPESGFEAISIARAVFFSKYKPRINVLVTTYASAVAVY